LLPHDQFPQPRCCQIQIPFRGLARLLLEGVQHTYRIREGSHIDHPEGAGNFAYPDFPHPGTDRLQRAARNSAGGWVERGKTHHLSPKIRVSMPIGSAFANRRLVADHGHPLFTVKE
jgi:hypothetical protein